MVLTEEEAGLLLEPPLVVLLDLVLGVVLGPLAGGLPVPSGLGLGLAFLVCCLGIL